MEASLHEITSLLKKSLKKEAPTKNAWHDTERIAAIRNPSDSILMVKSKSENDTDANRKCIEEIVVKNKVPMKKFIQK